MICKSQLFFLILVLLQFSKIKGENLSKKTSKLEIPYSTPAPNSKFLNPHLDEDTNLKLAIAAFFDSPEDTRNDKVAGDFSNPSGESDEDLPADDDETDFGPSKIFKNSKLVPYFNSLKSETSSSANGSKTGPLELLSEHVLF